MSHNETQVDGDDNYDFLAERREELEEKKMKLYHQLSLEEGDDEKTDSIWAEIENIEDELSFI